MKKGRSVMTKLADLKKTCDVLHLHPIPTKNAINKDTGEREKTLSMDDCIKSIQQFSLSLYLPLLIA